jgi:hypothetical protein
MCVTGLFSSKMSAKLKRHCYHSNGNDVIFVKNFQLLKDCSIYVVQFLSSNKKPLFKKLNLIHDLSYFKNCIEVATFKNCIGPFYVLIN